jgi:hypothetical protein
MLQFPIASSTLVPYATHWPYVLGCFEFCGWLRGGHDDNHWHGWRWRYLSVIERLGKLVELGVEFFIDFFINFFVELGRSGWRRKFEQRFWWRSTRCASLPAR